MTKRKKIPRQTKIDVLTEAGYRCAVPTCRTILALDLHHIEEVSEGGGNSADNLIALCPTCHALLHRGEIKRESIKIWKGMLVTLNRAFDQDAIDTLLFLCTEFAGFGAVDDKLHLSSDAVFSLKRLIIAGLVYVYKSPIHDRRHSYIPFLTDKGEAVVKAWKDGDRAALAKALTGGEDDTE